MSDATSPWNLSVTATAALMWVIMMAAMMLPTAAPWIWQLSRAWSGSHGWLLPVAFIGGYLLSWALFSLTAAVLQWLIQFPLAAAMPQRTMGGMILLMAGLYQWSGIKDRCLTHCRSPVSYFLTSWKPGLRGGFLMGFRHGLFCVGCCWLLMLLTFVVGMMNLFWMALLTLYVFIDHTLLRSFWIGKLVGCTLFGWGVWVLAGR